ncbi:type II toxin-antitoxin system RelE/ParE family toxin [Reichenbachiella versicolor]|uniref:type II toxin-antitoxin system RelE/ParE family toxin n=1 Tax=Reichenbachiella versicolor TaxID=1821036 RepID=UPI000D6E5FE1|nr:type II toxin-antitoxin system RelE/ParE family toxin [Reichenbachiella versicolor]
MAKLTLRQEAIDDLSDIWKYTYETWSENQADRYYEALKSACIELSTNSILGKVYPEISTSILGYNVNKHIIFYHVISEEEIEVVRILHERMDLKTHLK